MFWEDSDDRAFMWKAPTIHLFSLDGGVSSCWALWWFETGPPGPGFEQRIADFVHTARVILKVILSDCSENGDFHLNGITLYTNREPYPLCRAAVRMDAVVMALTRSIQRDVDAVNGARLGVLKCISRCYNLMKNIILLLQGVPVGH